MKKDLCAGGAGGNVERTGKSLVGVYLVKIGSVYWRGAWM